MTVILDSTFLAKLEVLFGGGFEMKLKYALSVAIDNGKVSLVLLYAFAEARRGVKSRLD